MKRAVSSSASVQQKLRAVLLIPRESMKSGVKKPTANVEPGAAKKPPRPASRTIT